MDSDNLIRAGVLLNPDDGLGAVSVNLVESGLRGPCGDNGRRSSRGLFQWSSLANRDHGGGRLDRSVTHGPVADDRMAFSVAPRLADESGGGGR